MLPADDGDADDVDVDDGTPIMGLELARALSASESSTPQVEPSNIPTHKIEDGDGSFC